VLRRAGGSVLERKGNVLPVLVFAFDPHAHRSLDRHEDSLERQTALVVSRHLVAALRDDRVHDCSDLVLARVEDEQPTEHAYLRGGETHAARLDHEPRHSLDQPPHVVVDLLDGSRSHAQGRIRILANLREGEPTPRVALGVELLLEHLSFDLGHDGHTTHVDRRERGAIMRQGVHRPETPQDRAEREALEIDLLESPVAGEPLRRRFRNFRVGADAALQALGGPLAWMRRLRTIELLIDAHEARLREVRDELRALHADDDAAFAAAWHELADVWSFDDVNELIARHNRNFPAESRLPMNPRTGDFVHVNGRPYTRAPLDGAWILERFPANGVSPRHERSV
jgi:hypothetical protein